MQEVTNFQNSTLAMATKEENELKMAKKTQTLVTPLPSHGSDKKNSSTPLRAMYSTPLRAISESYSSIIFFSEISIVSIFSPKIPGSNFENYLPL